MAKFQPHDSSKTPEWILMKLGVYNWQQMKGIMMETRGAVTAWVVWVNM